MRNLRKITIIFILTALILSSVAATPSEAPLFLNVGVESREVFLLQTRMSDLGYFVFRATGVYGAVTRNSVVALQVANQIMSDGTVGDQTYQLVFQNGVSRRQAEPEAVQEKGSHDLTVAGKTAEAIEWEDIKGSFGNPQNAVVTDYYTDVSFNVTLSSVDNGHVELDCVSPDDFAKFKLIFGDGVSWEKRPVMVKFGGRTSAASLFGMPHGFDNSPTNAMTGHSCLYFRGSTLNSLRDAEHEAKIDIVAGSGE